ncbi:leucine-rich repeat domain-containing protein [Patescibacteria group bacterium]
MKVTYKMIVITGLLFLGTGCSGNGSMPITRGGGDVRDIPPSDVSASTLDLSGSGLESIPSYVFDGTGLRELDLSDNELTGALPAEIRHLRHLRVLDVSGNAMTGVPAEVGQLSSLEELDLSDNELTGLPLELGNLNNLRLLDLRGNNVSQQDLGVIRAGLSGTQILE